MMDFHEWRESDDYEARKYRQRMAAGESANPDNTWIAASIAYKAGIEEGKRQAAKTLSQLVIHGMPKQSGQFG